MLYSKKAIDDERFRSLARGVYGQRQEGVQMIRLITIWKSNE
jgi:hypothetical protein